MLVSSTDNTNSSSIHVLCPLCNGGGNELVYEFFHTVVDEELNEKKHYVCSEGHFFQEIRDVFGNLKDLSFDKPVSVNE